MAWGSVVERARAEKTEQCLMGIGGSATNDGGFGLARAAGWKFLDASEASRLAEGRSWCD